jgi:hypothetical protein
VGDYNLAGWADTAFEQMVQALALRVISPGVTIFGAGPDGGREATYEGLMSFPSAAEPWSGYLVLQAKYRARPLGSPQDGSWALTELQKELEVYANPSKRRRCPDYYIFATNVVLTPVNERGSKDKTFQLIESYRAKVPIRDFAVWDFDQIGRFLDAYDGVRRAYYGFLTTGDILAKLSELLDSKEKNLQRAIKVFLAKELLADQYAKLEQAGYAADERIPLAQVFVDLPALPSRPVEENTRPDPTRETPLNFVARMLAESGQRLRPLQDERERPGVAALLDPYPGRYALVGGPGQGKTTLGQYVCQVFRAALLKDSPNSPEVASTVKAIAEKVSADGLELPAVRRFPVHCVLSDFASKFERDPDLSLISYLANKISRRCDEEVQAKDLRHWLEVYPWVVVLDGLDEVPPSTNRQRLLKKIEEFWADAGACNADVLLIATTRPQGYSDDFLPGRYRHLWLAPLPIEVAMHYAKRLVDVRWPNDEERRNTILGRLSQAKDVEATKRLMRSPLQVTIMTVLVQRAGPPPQDRWRLFHDYYETIYLRECSRDIEAAELLRERREEIDEIHRRVALLLQGRCERAGQTDAHLSEETFSDIVESRLREEGNEGAPLHALKKRIMDAAAHRLVFLVGVEANRIGFEIRSLQEFMAAEGLLAAVDSDVRRRLEEIAPVVSWRNVFLFAAGKCFASQQYLRDTVFAICEELNGDLAGDAGHFTLAGSSLALDLLIEGVALKQPKFAQLLARCALRLLELPADRIHVRIADGYSEDLAEVFKTLIEEQLKREQLSARETARTCLVALIDRGVLWAERTLDQHFPTNFDEIQRLFSSPAFSKGGFLANRLRPFLLRVPMWECHSVTEHIPQGARSNTLPFRVDSLWTHRPESARAAFEPNEEFYFTFASLGDKERFQDLILSHEPDSLPQWKAMTTAVEFALNPSAAALAKALRSISEAVDVRAWYSSPFPWPLAACCIASETSADFHRLADLADAGRLGDLDRWLNAEARWKKKGIDWEDVAYSSNSDAWPFDQSINKVGFAFTGSTGILRDVESPSQSENSLIAVLVRFYGSLTPSALRSIMGEQIVQFAMQTGSNSVFNSIKPEMFRKERRGHLITTNLLQFLLLQGQVSEPWIDVLDNLGRSDPLVLGIGRRIDTSDSGQQVLTKNLLVLAEQNPEKVGILFFLVESGVVSIIPDNDLELDPASYREKSIIGASILLTLATKDLTTERRSSLARLTAQLCVKHESLLPRLTSRLGLLPISSESLEKYLVEIVRELPDGFIERRYAISALSSVLQRRGTRLADTAVCQQLNLAPSVSRLLACPA